MTQAAWPSLPSGTSTIGKALSLVVVALVAALIIGIGVGVGFPRAVTKAPPEATGGMPGDGGQ